MLRDLRLAMRTLFRQPEFTLTAVLILALGIGATTAMFSVTNTLVLAPLPYPEPERLVRLYRTVEKDRGFPNPHSQSAYADYRRLGTVFEDATAYVAVQAKVAASPGDGGRRVSALRVTSNYFAVHGLRPLLGRGLAPGDDRLGGRRSVLLSWRFWQNDLGGDPDVVGRTVRIEEETHTVVGVMPREFNDLRRFWSRVELWYPLQLGPPPPRDRENRWLQVVARLRPGQGVKAAQAELDGLTARLNAQHGTRGGVQVVPLGETGVNQAETRAVQLTFWLAVVVLLIACFNLAGLQLARLASRQHEQAIRAALGAGRGRLIRQFLVESMLLCLAGGALGLLVATWLDPTQPSFDAKPLRERVDMAMANVKLQASILFGLAVLGLVLAALGIYGLFSGFVVQRTREIGLRVALGARSDQVLWMILARGLRLAAMGAVLGLAGAAAALRVLTATASELPAYDPAAIAVLGLALAAVALFACWLPARRAAALDPLVALRQD